MPNEPDTSSFDRSKAELFDALGHPVRIRILQALEGGPLGFSELRRKVGLESSGHLQFHLGKLDGLVKSGPDGSYSLTDDGKEALRMVEATGRATFAPGSAVLKAGPGRIHGRALVLLSLVVIVGAVMIAIGSVLGTETQVIPGLYASSDVSFNLPPGGEHLLVGQGNPGWSGTVRILGVVLPAGAVPSDSVELSIGGEGSFNGTIYVLVGTYVDTNLHFPPGLTLTNCSLVNVSSDDVTILGAYVRFWQVVYPYQALGEILLYLGSLVAVIDGAFLVWLLIRGRT